MKYSTIIQSEFVKEARKWSEMSAEDQKAYLKRHPKSKRKLSGLRTRDKVRVHSMELELKSLEKDLKREKAVRDPDHGFIKDTEREIKKLKKQLNKTLKKQLNKKTKEKEGLRHYYCDRCGTGGLSDEIIKKCPNCHKSDKWVYSEAKY